MDQGQVNRSVSQESENEGFASEVGWMRDVLKSINSTVNQGDASQSIN
jgi:hypothetical protein